MKLVNLINLVGGLPFFDLPTVIRLSGGKKQTILPQFHHWKQMGYLISLRRGWYTLSNSYRKVRLSPLRLANELYRPSYLTNEWALSYYGVIPEKVTQYTSVTTRVTRRFENPFGRFIFSSVKKELFWGFSRRNIDGEPVWIADPEKALLDLFYLQQGKWTEKRLFEMRLDLSGFDWERLKTFSVKWGSSRLTMIIHRLFQLSSVDQKGWKEL